MDRPYPAHWEADVVLRDGGTAHLRPIRPDDADRLVRFQGRLSDETIYFRFFSLYRELSPRDVERFTVVDHVDRVALIALVGDEMIGVVRYDRVGPDEAEVAFNIEDAHQGRGLGSVFLEHIAAAARERGISRFIADVLPANRKMLHVFEEAGYVVQHEYEDGVVRLEFGLEPTETSIEVRQAREHRAESRSVERLLRPASVAVVGVSRSPHSIGHTVLRHLLDGRFKGEVYAVNPRATEVAGVTAYPSVRDVPGGVELAVVAVPAADVEAVVEDCAAKGVLGLVVLSSGYAETGEEGRERQRRLVRLARANGMRVIGPSSFGVINTEGDVSLNASLSPVMPQRGRVGFFSQSGALGVALLDNVVRRGLGLSTFVSAGNRVDVSGNDLMQYWEEDPATDAVMLYLESIGNPRKFSRLARRLARRKPVVVVKSGRSRRGAPHGHVVRETSAPAAAIEALFRQAGVIRVESIHQLFDVGQLVAHQPLPTGRRVAILGNSAALGVLAADACEEAGLELVGEPLDLGAEATAADFRSALAAVFDDPGVDSVVALFIPPLRTRDEEVAQVLAAAASRGSKTVVSTFLGMRGVPEVLRPARGPHAVPSYPTPEDAVRALAAVTDYARWRATPAGRSIEPPGIDVVGARAVVAEALGDEEYVELDQQTLTRLLGCYGIELWPTVPVTDAAQVVEAADRLGYPVALKTLAPHLRHRSDLGGVVLNINNRREVRAAFAGMSRRLGPAAAEHFVLQRMAPTGVATVVGSVEDPLFGPVVSFGLGGVATELLGDRAYRIPPLTDLDVRDLVRTVRAAPLLFGHRGAEFVDVAALEDLLARVAHLADDLSEVAALELNPVQVSPSGVSVLAASGRLARPAARTDRGPRALPG
ncbi:MAG TPA: bifunctional GNAT family N-acetyltransferase/acetate--CoA ligase family protein [Actinomycetes bacterium]